MNIEYFSLSAEEVLKRLNSSVKGLSEREAKKRLQAEGLNKINSQSVSWVKIFFSQYANFLMGLLIFGCGLSFYLGEMIDGFVIFAILLINGALGTVQEYRAEKLALALAKLLPQKARVRRGGKEVWIDKEQVVTGDILLLENGQTICADCRIIQSDGFAVDESVLTGESAPVEKVHTVLPNAKRIEEMQNMLFAGTSAAAGTCQAVVVARGDSSEFGRIAALSRSAKKQSSFLKQVNGLSDMLFKVVIAVSIVLFFLLTFTHHSLGVSEIFLFVIALAIAIVPEMLPLISTLALSNASLKLAKKGVLLKRLSSLEDMGAAQVILTDKTGTLTENRLQLKRIYSEKPSETMQSALYASSALQDREHLLAGSFDAALLAAATEAQVEQLELLKYKWQSGFDPKHRGQFSVIDNYTGHYVHAKGAPENIVALCAIDDVHEQQVIATAKVLGNQGFRVLAVAAGPIPDRHTEFAWEQFTNLEYLGLIAFEDPLKKTAKEAIAEAKQMNLEVKILTGDSKEVALHVAKEVGLKLSPTEVMSGAEFSVLSSAQKLEAVSQVLVFARVLPEEKFEIVSLTQEQKPAIFLGEGINDAPALKRASVGLVVEEASEIAKESADVVLTRADLSVIVESVKRGRRIMSNISKYILITLTGNFGSLYALAFASVVFSTLPLLPTQVLLENILTDVPMIWLISARLSQSELALPVRQNLKNLVRLSLIIGSIVLGIQILFMFLYQGLPAPLFRTLWLVEIILMEFVLILSLRSPHRFVPLEGLQPASIIGFLAVCVFTVAMPYLPLISDLLHLVQPSLPQIWGCLLLVFIGYILLEAIKPKLLRR